MLLNHVSKRGMDTSMSKADCSVDHCLNQCWHYSLTLKATIKLRSLSLQEVAGLLFSLGGSYEAHSQLTSLSDENRRMLEQTQERSGRVFLRTGSSAEGLALVDLPGTVTSDIDLLCLMPSPSDVSIKGGGPLNLHTDNCPPGYTRISVNQKCAQYIDPFFIHHAKNRLYLWADAVKEASGSLWEERCGHMACHKSYHGAALRISVCDNTQELDLSHGIICDAPFEVMDEFLHRKRSTYWLNTFQLHRITKQRGVLVPRAPEVCRTEMVRILFRMSFCQPEVLLMRSLQPWMRKAALTFKYVMKNTTKMALSETCLSSYHLKNVLMWTLEEMNNSIWETASSVQLFKLLLKSLEKYLEAGRLPHYWNVKRNLFAYCHKIDINQALGIVSSVQKKLVYGTTDRAFCSLVNDMFTIMCDDSIVTGKKKYMKSCNDIVKENKTTDRDVKFSHAQEETLGFVLNVITGAYNGPLLLTKIKQDYGVDK